jgi:hypothetical protein
MTQIFIFIAILLFASTILSLWISYLALCTFREHNNLARHEFGYKVQLARSYIRTCLFGNLLIMLPAALLMWLGGPISFWLTYAVLAFGATFGTLLFGSCSAETNNPNFSLFGKPQDVVILPPAPPSPELLEIIRLSNKIIDDDVRRRRAESARRDDELRVRKQQEGQGYSDKHGF